MPYEPHSDHQALARGHGERNEGGQTKERG